MPKPIAHPKLRLIKPPAFINKEGWERLHLSSPGEALELDADRAAQNALTTETNFSFLNLPVRSEPIQESSQEMQEDQEEKKDRSRTHRKIMQPAGGGDPVTPKPSLIHPATHIDLGTEIGAGVPLEKSTRAEMEMRFGHDFSQVRVHTGEGSARSAESLAARAYTVGSEIVFGSGQYDAISHAGRDLLAHELAHVVQGDTGQIHGPSVMRRSTWESFKIMIGAEEGDFTDDELLAYLKLVTDNKGPEGSYDSDNKARAIVNRMKANNPKFKPDAQQKVWLIKEMQSGFTGDDDEQAILYLLNISKDAELSKMLAGGLDLVDLDSDMHGKEEDLYHMYLDSRFEGGAKAVLSGKIKQKPWTETFGKMEAEVSDIKDIEEVKRIRKDIKDNYDIDLDSDVGIEGIKKEYPQVPAGVTAGLKKRPWHLDELHALERALGHYAPILGKGRASSTRAKAAQEVTSVSKIEQAIDVDAPTGVLDTTTRGELFETKKNFSLFKAAEGSTSNFPGDPAKELEGIMTHELAHGLLKYALPSFVSRFKYWINKNVADADKATRIAKHSVEAPITFYGGTSAWEDISETAKFYFVDPAKLKAGFGKPKGTPGNPAPERFDFLDKAVKKWTPPPKKPKGKKP